MVNAAAFPEVPSVRRSGRHTTNTHSQSHGTAAPEETPEGLFLEVLTELYWVHTVKGSRDRRQGIQEGPGLNMGRRGWNSIRMKGLRTQQWYTGRTKDRNQWGMPRWKCRGTRANGERGNFLELGQVGENGKVRPTSQWGGQNWCYLTWCCGAPGGSPSSQPDLEECPEPVACPSRPWPLTCPSGPVALHK